MGSSGLSLKLAGVAALVAAALRAGQLPGSPWWLHGASDAAARGWDAVKPGGRLHPQALLDSHAHVLVEGLLLVAVGYLLLQKSFKPAGKGNREAPLSRAEEDALIAEWEPEPLVPPPPKGSAPPAPVREVLVEQRHGPHVVVEGRPVLDATSADYLGLAGDERIARACLETIAKYGVGSCGPRGFYGTFDVHLELETAVAKYMGTPDAIVYSYDATTMPSVVPPFANARDLIVVDEGVSHGIWSGVELSRAKVLTFKHNDVQDLERCLQSIADQDRKRPPKQLNRRFVAVEGVYARTGDVAPLAAIYELAKKHKFRLIVDESDAIGVLGATGRGALEAAGLPADAAEIVGASLSTAVASIGGFCTGSKEVVEHQRLSGLGYCFSASQPPYTAVAATKALEILADEGDDRRAKAHANAKLFRQLAARIPQLRVLGDALPESAPASLPLVHLRLARDPAPEGYERGDAALQAVCDEALRDGVLVATAKYSMLERNRPPPSIRVHITAAHTEDEVRAIAGAIARAASRVLA